MEKGTVSFWDKKEGLTGKIILSLIAGGLLIVLYKLLPYIITFLSNTGDAIILAIRVALLLGVLGILCLTIYAVKDGIIKFFENLSWKITDFVIGLDSITSMKTDIKNMVKKKKDFDLSSSKVYGRVSKLEERESTNAKEALRQLKMAEIAKSKGDAVNSQVAANQAARLKTSNDQMKPVLDKIRLTHKKLQGVSGALDFFIKDKSNLVVVLEEQYLAIKDAVDAMKSAEDTLGSNNEASMFNRAVQIAQEEMARGMGYIDMIMNSSQKFIDQVDLEKGLLDSNGTELLKQFENGDFDNIIAELNRVSSLDSIKVQAQQETIDQSSKFKNLYN